MKAERLITKPLEGDPFNRDVLMGTDLISEVSILPFCFTRPTGSRNGAVPVNGSLMRQMREQADLSQDRLGKKVQLSGGMISLVECGRGLSPKALERVAEALGTDFNTLRAEGVANSTRGKEEEDPLKSAIRTLSAVVNNTDLVPREPKDLAQDLQAVLGIGNKLAIAIELSSKSKIDPR